MKLEKRAAAAALTATGKTIAGYAAVFNSPTGIGDMWLEVIERGAFTASLASGDDVLALYSHELERLLGRRSSGTLRLTEDDKGLRVEIDLPDTSDGRDVATLIERGDLKGMSFGFCVTRQEWDETADPPVRTIKAVDLREVTVTADPAYPDTEVGMMELESVRRDRRSIEKDRKRLGYFARKALLDQRQRGL